MSDRNMSTVSSQAVRTRSILRNTYLWMTGGLALTGVVALGVASNPEIVRALVTNRFLFFGLIISNIFKVPKILKTAGQTEFFVKIGLVCMGATILFSVVLKAGAIGPVTDVIIPIFKVSAAPATTGRNSSMESKKKTISNEILFIVILLTIFCYFF